MKKGCAFSKLNFHLGFIKIAMEKFPSENNNINRFYSCDSKRGNIRCGAGPYVNKTVNGSSQWGTIPGQE